MTASHVTTAVIDAKRLAIVDAALRHFCERGFAAARIADIAEAAQVGKGTVYEYFRSKEQLLLAACERSSLLNQAEVEQALGGHEAIERLGRMNPVKALHTVLRTVTEVVLLRSRQYARLFIDLISFSQDHPDQQPPLMDQARDRLVAVYVRWEGMVHELYLSGVAQGYFREPAHNELMPRLYTALVDGLVWHLMFRHDRTPEQIAAQSAELFVTLLLANPGRFRELSA